MKKILIINTTLNKGGAARVAYDLFNRLNDEFEMCFAYGRGEIVNEKGCFKFGSKLEFFLHAFLVRLFGLEGFGSYFSTKKLLNYIENGGFDLIHLHNLHGYYVNFFKLVKFLQEKNIPVIWTLHDEWATTWLPAYTESYNNEKATENFFRNKNIYPKNYLPLFKNLMIRKKTKIFSNNWNPVLVCPSDWLMKKINNSYLKNFLSKVIYNGVDTKIFKPINDKRSLRLKYDLPVDKNIVLFVAANFNDKRKGIRDILFAAKSLSNDCIFVGVGSGDIESIKNVKIFSYINNKSELAELYCLSDIFCFASSAETFFLTVAESLSCGTPVVGYNIPVVLEVFKGDVGDLVDLNNRFELTKKIQDLLNNPERRLAMSDNGRKLILENYSQEIFYKKYSDLYNSILNK